MAPRITLETERSGRVGLRSGESGALLATMGATDFQRNISAYYADNFDIMWTQGADLGQHPGWDSRPGGWTVPPGASYSTWEGGVISDLAKVHALRKMPGFVKVSGC